VTRGREGSDGRVASVTAARFAYGLAARRVCRQLMSTLAEGEMTETIAPRSALALVGDSGEWLAPTLESVLRPIGCRIVCAGDGQSLVRRAGQDSPDIVITEASLPDMGPAAVCAALRDDPRLPRSLPILVISAFPLDRQRRVDILRAGAWQVLSHPLDPEELVATVDNFLTVKAATDAAESRALLDGDTGLYNVRGVLRRSQELFAAAVRMRRPLTCLAVAATPASREADAEFRSGELQYRLGRLLRGTVRASDAVGRLGGAEFVILAPETDRTGARRLADRILNVVRDVPAPQPDAELRIHIGGYVIEPGDGPRPEALDLLVRALSALRHTQAARVGDAIRFHEDVPAKVDG